MKALLLEAEWKPREGYRLNPVEIATKSSYNGNQTYYNPQAKMIDMPVPKPGAQQVLVKVKATGVCGSDVHMYQHDEDNYMAYPGHCRFPCVLGHEWSGEVVELGAGVTSLKVGDGGGRGDGVVRKMHGLPEQPVDQCTQLEEIGFTMQGAYAEYVAVPEKHCWSIIAIAEAYGDKKKAYEIGAMVEPCCVAYNGIFISAGGFLPGSNVVVAGCGPVGLMGISLARASGAAKVIVMEPSEGRRQMAKKMGADYVFDPTSVEKEGGRPADTIMDITSGDGAHVCIEARRRGALHLPDIRRSLDPVGQDCPVRDGREESAGVGAACSGRGRICTACRHSGGIFLFAIRLLAAKQMDLSPMVTSRFSLDKALEAIQTAEKLQDAKVMVIQD